MSSSVTTPGQVATTAAAAIGFGLFVWLMVRYVITPIWGRRSTNADWLFEWAVPGVFVIGGLVAELVAAYGAITGTVWHSN